MIEPMLGQLEAPELKLAERVILESGDVIAFLYEGPMTSDMIRILEERLQPYFPDNRIAIVVGMPRIIVLGRE